MYYIYTRRNKYKQYLIIDYYTFKELHIAWENDWSECKLLSFFVVVKNRPCIVLFCLKNKEVSFYIFICLLCFAKKKQVKMTGF